ncbi:hypothetical protein [Agromyces archimandritae]|uniref:Uncharacterized protein n=1 Tax=Agromyces archimandritae TaxID=2781962 RepID=A0A975FKS9_9MICO|nr:hypothetical protein [Agromyces archimandritae]QTX03686.1 hypothetical protein G127AT_10100 [Agromyces archimandritae]
MSRAGTVGRPGEPARPAPPGAFRRFARDRGHIAVTGALALAGLLVGLLPAGFGWALHGADAERGPYDLIVTAGAEEVEASASEDAPTGGADATDPFPGGLIPPGFVTGHRLSLEALEQIRGVKGVEVAAPIGTLLAPVSNWVQPQFVAAADVGNTEPNPQAFRAVIETYADDGTGERMVDRAVATLSLDRSEVPGRVLPPEEAGEGTCTVDGVVVDIQSAAAEPCRTMPYDHLIMSIENSSATATYTTNATSDAGTLQFSLSMLPGRATWAAVIDPVAEAALLGEPGPLQSLIDFEAARDAGDLRPWVLAMGGEQRDGLIAYLDEAEEAGAASWPGWLDSMLPVLTLESAAPGTLRQRIGIEPLGPAPVDAGGNMRVWDMGDAPATGPMQWTDIPLDDRVSTFKATDPVVRPWPDAPAEPPADRDVPVWMTGIDGRPMPAAPPVIDDAGHRAPAQYFRLPATIANSSDPTETADAADDAAIAGYLTTDPRASRLSSGSEMRLPVDAGSVDPETLAIDGALAGGRTLVADADGEPIDPVRLRSSLTGVGAGDGEPGLIVSFDALGSMLPRDPIHAVRVRVAGADAGRPAAVRAIEQTATRLERAGFVVTPAAGMREIEREYVLDGYRDADGIRTLGTVQERWTELAATDAAPGPLVQGTAWLAAAAALVGLAAFEFAGLRRRRDEALVLRSLGHPAANVFWWFAGPAAITFGAALLVSQAALAIARAAWASTIAETLAAGALVIGGASAAASVVGPEWMPGRTATRVLGALRHPLAAVVAGTVLLLAALAAATALTVAEVRAAGAAFFADAPADPYYLVPLALALLAAAVGAALALRGRAAGRREARRRADPREPGRAGDVTEAAGS